MAIQFSDKFDQYAKYVSTRYVATIWRVRDDDIKSPLWTDCFAAYSLAEATSHVAAVMNGFFQPVVLGPEQKLLVELVPLP